jgi:acyl-CoA thioesterase-1
MTTTTVTATYLNPDETACAGRVVFQLVAATYHDGLDAIFPTVPVTAVLDANGDISVELEPTSGVSADFDATDMTYQVRERINGADRDVYYVDIPTAPAVDLGTLVTYSDPLPVTRVLVDVDAASVGYATTAAVDAADLALATATPRPLNGSRWVALGDSITAGSDTVATFARGQSWPTYLGATSQEAMHLVFNAGVTGTTSTSGLARYAADVSSRDPSLVTIMLGNNDISNSVPIATWKTNIAALVAAVRADHAAPVLVALAPSNVYQQTVTTWNHWLRRYAGSQSITLLDPYAALVDPATGDYLAAMSSDGIHPTDAGYSAMAELFWDQIGPLVSPPVGPRVYDAADLTNLLLANPLWLDHTLGGVPAYHPTGYSLVNPTSLAGASFVSGTGTVQGDWYRMTVAANASTVTVYPVVNPVAVNGHVYGFTGRIRVNLSVNGGVYVQLGDGVTTQYPMANLKSNVDGRFWGYCTVTGTAVAPSVRINNGSTGTVDIAELAVFDLTALGITDYI